jgi:hypothetical protein
MHDHYLTDYQWGSGKHSLIRQKFIKVRPKPRILGRTPTFSSIMLFPRRLKLAPFNAELNCASSARN